MTIVVPNASEALLMEFMLGKTTPEGQVLKLFSSNTTPGEATTAASFSEVSGGGYAAKTLTPANWTVTAGDPAVALYAQQTFSFTGGVGNVYGYYIVGATSGTLLWAERFTDGPYAVSVSGDTIRVTPRMTLKDQQDA